MTGNVGRGDIVKLAPPAGQGKWLTDGRHVDAW
jgi:hypothetical protein